jgi:hypothetical protein
MTASTDDDKGGEGGSGPKRFLLRLDPRTYDELRAWAETEMRSVNGQIEFLITDALRRRKRGDQGGKPQP